MQLFTCTSPCHQLAVAYCLRALSTQETEPNSKTHEQRVLEDISAAINLWLGISTPDNCSPADKWSMLSENTILLLYNVIDLLSIKGCTDFHSDIHRLMIRLFKWSNVPLEKCVLRFWECRRISHALCASPVNETFIMNISDHCGELSKSISFWIDCLKDSKQLLLAFQHSFSFLFPNFSRGPCNHESLFRSDTEVKQAAFELISQAPVSTWSAYVAGYLYYDLSERLVSNGRLIEALSYAKEAHNFSQSLPLFTNVFSTVLGKLYHKQQLWDLAQKELQSAKEYFGDSSSDISCWKCRLMLEATVNPVFLKIQGSTSSDKLSHAENLYKSAIAKLNLSEWKILLIVLKKSVMIGQCLEKLVLKTLELVVYLLILKKNSRKLGKSSRRG
ncbi:hypothetical protein ACFX13_045184 [Malus domestica]